MCGILGARGLNLENQLKFLEHRGPDSRGVFHDRSVFLGHTRLSIIDLSNRGKQPMSDSEGKIWITFNGEIYNFREIKKELENEYTFKSGTDTEVIIYAYKKYGIQKMLELFNGMFAFCIYDKEKQRLVLARDKFGEKPLYYSEKPFIFSSEITPIFDVLKPPLDKHAINQFLNLRYFPHPITPFKGIKKLPPGHVMIYSIQTGTIRIERYYSMKREPLHNFGVAKRKLNELMKDSVRYRLMADVPVGVFLSGGIDSSVIAKTVSELNEKTTAYTIRFENPLYDESEHAEKLCGELGLNFKRVHVGDMFKYIDDVTASLDEPIGDPACIPLYLLAKEARKEVKVVLTGDGADELFMGYEQCKVLKFWEIARKLRIHKIMVRANRLVPDSVKARIFKFYPFFRERVNEIIENVLESDTIQDAYNEIVTHFKKEEFEKLTGEPIEPIKVDSIDEILQYEMDQQLAEDFLMKVDKMTMAHALEARVPYLDHRLVELAFSLPTAFKLNKATDKYILRKSFNLPTSAKQRKKQRFFVPIHEWVDKPRVVDTIEYGTSIGLFNKSYTKAQGDFFKARQLWNMFIISEWTKRLYEHFDYSPRFQ